MKYMLVEVDTELQERHYSFQTEEELNERIEKIDSDVEELFVYQLQKQGKRVSSINWAGEEPKRKSNGYDMNVIANPPVSPGARKSWTGEEKIYLREAKKMGMSYKGIANKLGRTTHAVQVMASRIECA